MQSLILEAAGDAALKLQEPQVEQGHLSNCNGLHQQRSFIAASWSISKWYQAAAGLPLQSGHEGATVLKEKRQRWKWWCQFIKVEKQELWGAKVKSFLELAQLEREQGKEEIGNV